MLLRRELLVLLLIAVSSTPAFAHRDDYLEETLVYETLERREIEPEYWLDYGYDRGIHNHFFRHHGALEYGITDRWMIDGRATLRQSFGQAAQFESARVETRYRFRGEGSLPVDIAISAEVNTELSETGQRQYGFEPRLILSKDIKKKLNLTLNLAEEIGLNRREYGFAPAAGFRYNASKLIGFGSEFKYETDAHRGSITPQIWFKLGHGTTIKTGISIGVGPLRRTFGRVAFEKEF